jgi:hypothetical protein
MWNVRSAADRVVPAFFCLIIFTLIADGAEAQTAAGATDSKRVQVLQIREGAAAKEIAVKKPKSAATRAKKKAAHRNNLSQIKAGTNEAAPPAQDDISTPTAEQTGTLGVGDRLVAFASPPAATRMSVFPLQITRELEKNRQARLPPEIRRAQTLTPSNPLPVRCSNGRSQPAALLCHRP